MPKSLFSSKALLAACLLSTHLIEASIRVVNSISDDPNTIGTLPYWLLNANSGDIIDCGLIAGQSITLTTSLPAITKSYTINGAGITINGDSNYQAFQVASGTVSIHNVKVENAISKGGNGGDGYSGGGGAAGGGGALYIHGDTSVTLTASSLLNNTAQGGNGGSGSNNGNAGGGGGGGFGGGNGGTALTNVSTGGGGGGHSNGGNGGSGSDKNGSNGVYFGGGGGGAGINEIVPGGTGGNASPTGTYLGGAQAVGNGGGGAGDSENGFSASGSGGSGIPGNGGNGIGSDSLFGGGGGGGAASETGFPAGTGVGAAGGGGGSNYSGGNGGILGGGGGGGLGGVGGEGGFGAGGGGAVTGGLGGGGFNAGGGNGASDPGGIAGGGGGSGLGGAIFIQRGASLTIMDAAEISGNTAIAGVGGSSTHSSDPCHTEAGNGAAMGYDIFMREEGSITFNLSNTLTIATPIEGDQTNGPNSTGGLYKIGEGTLKLNGANTYSGITSIAGGTLNLNGSVIGSAIVGAGGKLSGNATVFGNLTNFGILAPGNSIGTINTTNLLLKPTSVLEIEVAANGLSDLISATGTAEINGTLEIIPSDNFQTLQTFTIVTAASGRTGTFSRIKSSVPSLLRVIYDPAAIEMEVLPISALDLNHNAESAADCYLASGFTPGSDVEAVNAALLTLDVEGISEGFNQMQPSQFCELAWSQMENALLIRSSYFQHLEEINLLSNCCNCSGLWEEAIGACQTQNLDDKQFGYIDWTGGATVGWDFMCCNEFKQGIALSYTHSRLDWNQSAGHANFDSFYCGYYTSWSKGWGYVNTAVLGSYSHYRTNRHLHFASIDRHAKSSHNSWEGLAGLEAGVNFDYDEYEQITPFVRVDYIYLSRQSFLEHGASSLNLHIGRAQSQTIQSELGVIWRGYYVNQNTCMPGIFLPRLKLSYILDAPLCNHLHANFIDSGCDFTVQGIHSCQNLGAISIGSTFLNCNETIAFTIRYEGQFTKNYCNQAANFSLNFLF